MRNTPGYGQNGATDAFRHDVPEKDVIALWLQGYTLAALAKKYKCSMSTIDRRIAFGGGYQLEHLRVKERHRVP